MVILYLFQQTNTCSKSATESLEVTEDNPNENIFKKQNIVKCFVNFIGKHLCKSLFSKKKLPGF